MKAIAKDVKDKKIEIVLKEMRKGNSLRKAAATADVARQTFHDWVDKDEDLSVQYARARADMIDSIADDIMNITDEELEPLEGGKIDNAMVQKQRLRVDTRKWLLSKMAPKKYGDKLELSGNEESPVAIKRIERVIVKK